jgi:hypothetical protein
VARSSHLIATARQLAYVHQRRPRQADLRRSISTSYYALFHGLAELAAGRLVGSTSTAQKSAAWSRVYRDLNHLAAKKACSRPDLQGCSQELARFLMAFPHLQELRHQADYDPIVRFKQGEALSPLMTPNAAWRGSKALQGMNNSTFITLALGMTRS